MPIFPDIGFGQRLATGLLVLNLAVASVAAVIIDRSRAQALVDATTDTVNLSEVLGNSISGLIDNVDLILQFCADEISPMLVQKADNSSKINRFLKQQQMRVPDLVNIRVIDEKGDLRFGSEQQLPVLNNADRDFFIQLRNDPNTGLFIAKPRLGKTTKRKLLTFARRLNRPDGSFAGVVYASIQLEHFDRLFSIINVGKHGSVALRAEDLSLIARFPDPGLAVTQMGSKVISVPFMEAFKRSPEHGTYISGATSTDGISRMHSYHLLKKYPMLVNVGLAEEDYLAGWRQRAWVAAILVIVFMLSTLLFSVALMRAMRATKKTDARFRALADSSPIALALNDDTGRITYLNPAFTQTFGYTLKDIPSLADWWPRAYPDAVYRLSVVNDWGQRLAEAERTHTNFKPMEIRVCCKDGSQRDVIASASRLDSHGNPEQDHLVTLFDITEHKSLEAKILENEQRLTFALEGAGDGLWDWNIEDGKVLFSKRWKEMLGYAEDEIGDSLEEWEKRVHPDDLPGVMAEIQRYFSGAAPTYVNEHRVLCKDGSFKWILDRGIVVSRDQDGNPLRMIGTHSDIDVRRKAEEAKQSALLQAEQLAEAKSNFLANMSHEIRTPMNGIIGLTQLALHQTMSSDLRDYLTKISSSSQSLLCILNDILDISKMDAGRMTIETAPYDLDEILDNLRGLFSAKAESQGLAFDIRVGADVPRDLIGDPLRIQQVLTNLLGNAIKFTPQGSVTMQVSLLEMQDSQANLRFSVTDTGIGISMENQGKLFQPFNQLDASTTRRFGGTGLGLAISNNLVQLMGSHIEVSTPATQGSTFSFDLLQGIPAHTSIRVVRNRRKSRENTLAELSRRSSRFAGTRILIAEDNPINQQVVKEFLTLSGLDVTIAGNGREALQMLDQEAFDAVLMDAHMPVMDGFEATQEIRRQPRFDKLPVIALTAGVTEEERRSCLESGMNDFIAKPVNPEALIKKLEKWVTPKALQNAESAAPEPEDDHLALPGFQLDNLMRMLGGNRTLTIELLISFAADMSRSPEEIQAASAAGDFEQARQLAHKVKGAAGNVGAVEVHAAAGLLEADFKAGLPVPEHMTSFADAMRAALTAIGSLEAPPMDETEGDWGAFKTGATALAQKLSDNEFIEEEALNALMQQLSPKARENFRQVCLRIGEIRYAEARNLLLKMIEPS